MGHFRDKKWAVIPTEAESDRLYLIPHLVEFAQKDLKIYRTMNFFKNETMEILPGNFFPGPGLFPTGFTLPSARNWLPMPPLKLSLRLKR